MRLLLMLPPHEREPTSPTLSVPIVMPAATFWLVVALAAAVLRYSATSTVAVGNGGPIHNEVVVDVAAPRAGADPADVERTDRDASGDVLVGGGAGGGGVEVLGD